VKFDSKRIFGAYLETLVLEHTLDGSILTRRRQLGLEDHAEGAVSHDLALRVLHLFCFSGKAILDLLTNDFCHVC